MLSGTIWSAAAGEGPEVKQVRTHIFGGVKYKIDAEPHDGSCDAPSGRRMPCIMIPGGIKSNQRTLYVFIHEALHAGNWPATEAKVEQTAKDISKLLWRLGYRLRGY